MTQTIRRAARRHRFVVVDQSAIEDTRLSWAARGLLAYLLSRPDDWRVLVNDLRKRGNLGRDGIYALLRELRRTGYVQFERKRDDQGRMRGGTYIVSEIPSPHPGSPHVAEPDAAAPRAARPDALPTTDRYEARTTTTPPTTKRACNAKIQRRFPAWLPEELQADARPIVDALDTEGAQLVIDEWTGALEAGEIRVSPIGYLRTLAARFEAGTMVLRFAREDAE